ncbi:ankyrin repeat-containing domain protein [Microdochium trichocladiopsis]|uniref:Ankyrin repeat-containing domain protein n=1 Tax=Microdochium trichocladiopsis TaxID=1682393 RepID=A0A9P9BLB7_9PEZI|nr:ankyrin repeat-containing domain protein [Microdochium trichocladiopsis]KAH7024729.1 ankyrin repeat-containing domain protein [Microdochium trichocladiopsis]
MPATIQDQLNAAAASGDVEQLQALCQSHRQEISTRDAQELLATATEAFQASTIDYLLTEFPEMEIKIDAVAEVAAGEGSIPIFSKLVARDPTIASRRLDRTGTPLSVACTGRQPVAFLRYLLELGADPNQNPDLTGYPIALVAGLYPDDEAAAAIDLLLEHGARLEHSGALGHTAVLGREASLRFLLEKGAKPDTDAIKIGSKIGGSHPLHDVLWGGHIGAAKLLLDHSSSINVHDQNGKSIMEKAAHLEAKGKDRSEIITLLSEVEKERSNQ